MPFNERARQMTGRVVSNKMDKTVVVTVESMHRHRLYKHTVRTTKRYKAHDERNECREGDTVRIIESRPLSKDKRWRVVEIMRHDERATPQQVAATVPSAPQDLVDSAEGEG
jgi:small subunit ribosomal protein S17